MEHAQHGGSIIERRRPEANHARSLPSRDNAVVAVSEDVRLSAQPRYRRVGVVVHPSRTVDSPLRALREWTDAHGFEVVQVAAPCRQQEVAERGDAGKCDLIVSIGGDGTALAALRTGACAGTPVLGVAYGSLGALTSVDPDEVADAIEHFTRGEWVARSLPALEIRPDAGEDLVALNALVIIRAGEGQVRLAAHIDDVLFARFAGDGCIVSTPAGSSAYALSAGGPLLASDMRAFALTPLPTHGGAIPPLVIGAGSELRLQTDAGYGGWRIELDGQIGEGPSRSMSIRLRPDAATLVAFERQESLLSGLRRRRIIMDSPRMVAEDARD
jgi:NAD+ kinase